MHKRSSASMLLYLFRGGSRKNFRGGGVIFGSPLPSLEWQTRFRGRGNFFTDQTPLLSFKILTFSSIWRLLGQLFPFWRKFWNLGCKKWLLLSKMSFWLAKYHCWKILGGGEMHNTPPPPPMVRPCICKSVSHSVSWISPILLTELTMKPSYNLKFHIVILFGN